MNIFALIGKDLHQVSWGKIIIDLVHADSKLFQPRSFKSFPAQFIQQSI